MPIHNIPPLTSLRFFLAAWVVIFHSRGLLPQHPWFWRNFTHLGYTAFILFFVLSGLLLALNYLGAERAFDTRRFFRARAA
ncbi:MAG: acyltransferase, partial [Parcubacteria group bacterium]